MMPYNGRRTVTALFAFTFIIHNGSGVYRTSSNKNCKYCEYFFESELIPDPILKSATDVESSPRVDGDGKNFIQRPAQEKMDTKFADYCKVFCKSDFQISGGNLKQGTKLRRGSEMMDDRALEKKFQSKKNGKSASSIIIGRERDFQGKNHQPSLGSNPPAGESRERGEENLRVSRRVKKDSAVLNRRKRDASDARSLRQFRREVGDGNGYGDPNPEDYGTYNDDYGYGARYSDGYQDYGSQHEAEDDLYDEYPSDEGRQPNRDEARMDVEARGKSSRGSHFGSEIAEAPGRRIWEMEDARRSKEEKPCNCTKEFEKYMSALLKDAFVVIEGALKQLSKWVSSLRSTPAPAAVPVQSDPGNMMKFYGEPKERNGESFLPCDSVLGVADANNLLHPTEATSMEREAASTSEPEKETEASIKKSAEVGDTPSTESDEEDSLSAFPTTRQAEREESDTTPEPEATTELWPPNHVTFPSTTRKMDVFADEPAAWTEAAPEFTESSATTFRTDEDSSTAASAAKTDNATQTKPALTRGNAILQPNAKASKDPPALCNLRNLKKPQFLPLILEALKYGRH